MIYAIKRLIKPCIYLALILPGLNVNAQVSLLQQTIDKIESYKNISYQYILKQKEYTSDTLVMKHKDVFVKTPQDKVFGYLFNLELMYDNMKVPSADLYNGQNMISITPNDSTYRITGIKASVMQGTLFGRLKWIGDFAEKNQSKLVQTNDTTINAVACFHLVANTRDTTINKEHYYTRIHIFIDKQSGLPNAIMIWSRNADTANGITNYYSENRYFDYKLNHADIDMASITIPKGFHPPQERPIISLLAPGTIAPDCTLYAADGEKLSLTQLKGKVVLLDFFFIGCSGCMASLKPLNNLHEKFKNQNVIIASITHRDSQKSVMAFAKNYNIKYPMYVNGADAVKSYHVERFPTFYFIDKQGKIANTVVGYGDDFEEKMTSIMSNLLNK